jgi:hypothetical protein
MTGTYAWTDAGSGLKSLYGLIPEAVSMRTHALFQSTP